MHWLPVGIRQQTNNLQYVFQIQIIYIFFKWFLEKLQDANGILYDAFVATKKNLQGRGQLILKDLMRIVHCTRNNYTHKPPRKGTDYEAIYKEFMEEIFDRLGISKKDYYKDFTESIDNAISLSICKRNCAEYKGYSETISELALTESADDIFMYTFKYYTRLSPRTNDYFFYAVRARVEIVLKKRGCPKDYAEL